MRGKIKTTDPLQPLLPTELAPSIVQQVYILGNGAGGLIGGIILAKMMIGAKAVPTSPVLIGTAVAGVVSFACAYYIAKKVIKLQ